MSSGVRRRVVYLTDMLDAVGATGRTTATGDDKRERSFDEWHAVFVQRQQMVHRQWHVTQIFDEWPRKIDK